MPNSLLSQCSSGRPFSIVYQSPPTVSFIFYFCLFIATAPFVLTLKARTGPFSSFQRTPRQAHPPDLIISALLPHSGPGHGYPLVLYHRPPTQHTALSSPNPFSLIYFSSSPLSLHCMLPLPSSHFPFSNALVARSPSFVCLQRNCFYSLVLAPRCYHVSFHQYTTRLNCTFLV